MDLSFAPTRDEQELMLTILLSPSKRGAHREYLVALGRNTAQHVDFLPRNAGDLIHVVTSSIDGFPRSPAFQIAPVTACRSQYKPS